MIYLVARVDGKSLADPELVAMRDTGSTILPATAAGAYSQKKPGMKLAVWVLGGFPAQFVVNESGEGVHELARNAVKV